MADDYDEEEVSTDSPEGRAGSNRGGSFGVHPLLPIQLLRKQIGRGQGERRLMIAVLEDAVDTFMKHALAISPKECALLDDTNEYFGSDDRIWPFSFKNICETLDLDPNYLRNGLSRWRREFLKSATDRRIGEIQAPHFPDREQGQ